MTDRGSDRKADLGADRRIDHGAEWGPDPKAMIEGFIDTQVTGRGLDERTEKAYRLDLEHFYIWLEQERAAGAEWTWEEEMEAYLDHLLYGKGLRPSTINRKQRVLSYYLAYLVKRGELSGCRKLKKVREESGSPLPGAILAMPVATREVLTDAISAVPEGAGTISSRGLLSKKEVDLFFRAINREYEDLDSSFRKRVCLRDLVMMELLFYHGIEVSELLRMEVSDYDRKTGMLTVRRKRDRSYSVYLFSQDLRERMGMWLEEHAYFERDEEYCDRMFLSKMGRPLSMKMVITIFDKYRVMAGIQEEFTPKDLKKSMKRYARELVMEWCG